MSLRIKHLLSNIPFNNYGFIHKKFSDDGRSVTISHEGLDIHILIIHPKSDDESMKIVWGGTAINKRSPHTLPYVQVREFIEKQLTNLQRNQKVLKYNLAKKGSVPSQKQNHQIAETSEVSLPKPIEVPQTITMAPSRIIIEMPLVESGAVVIDLSNIADECDITIKSPEHRYRFSN